MERFVVRPEIAISGNRYWTVVDLESPPDSALVVASYGEIGEGAARNAARRLNNLQPGQEWFV